MNLSYLSASSSRRILSGLSRSLVVSKRCHYAIRIASFSSAYTSPSPARPPSQMATPDNAAGSGATSSDSLRYIDIGINLADPVFRGNYYGKQRHPDDLKGVVSRAQEVGCQKMIITGSDFGSSRRALEIAEEFPGAVYTTAGIHPCSSSIFGNKHSGQDEEDNGHTAPCEPDTSEPIDEAEPDLDRTKQIIQDLRKLVEDARAAQPGVLVALGEFGLDYDRLQLCSKKVQLHSFAAQLDLVLDLKPQLPLFLHSRAAHEDFVGMMKAKFGPGLEKLEKGGVVHSFTGTVEEMRELMDLGLYIGTNGCSFKTADNCAVVKEIHLDRLMLETDGPWCEIRPAHEGWKYLVAAAAPATAPSSAPESSTEASSAVATPASSTTPAPPTPEGTTAAAAAAETTSTPPSQPAPQKKQQQQQQQSKKKPQKKEPLVPERYKSVKKEKWTEGAMIKGRNEPCTIDRVARVVAGVKGLSEEEVCEAAWANTVKVFGL